MKRQLRYLALYCLFIALGCVHGAVFAAITNQASVSYADPKSSTGASAKASNEVKTILPETISYYTSAAFAAPATAAAMNQRLFVQATSAECNTDPATVQNITIAMTSRMTGDTENYNATETGPDTGVFRIMSMVAAVDASQAAVNADPDSPGVVAGDGSIAVAKNDTLTATIKGCGSGQVQSSVLIDPSGIVFDSKTGLPLAGATVTLIDVTGAGNGGLAGGPAIVFRADGVTRASATYVTGADGVYRFPLVGASLYRLAVTPPSNYTFPSKVAPGALPGDHAIHLYGSFGADFIVSAATGAVVLDVPLDPIPGTLYLEKTASRSTADVGDFVDYTVRVHNTAEQALLGVTVTDELPAGFSLVPGSVRLEGAPLADPAGGRGPTLQFGVGTVPATGSVALRYRARIGGGALQGDGINRAHATSSAPLIFTSSVAAAKVKVSAGVFSEKGYIVGQVYADCDGNGLRDENEPGVPGVRIYLEDGSFSQTDADGRYSFADLRPRTHVAKVDGATLPAGAQLKVLANRNSFDAGSRFVDLHNGELAKADFALDACTPAVRDAIKARGTALKDAERRAAATVTAANAPAPAAAKAAASLDTLDSTLGFVDLVDGAVLPGANVKVRVKGGAGATFTLRVNGVAVLEQHIGQRSTVAARQLEVWEFVGVTLRPGENVLEVAQVDSFGNPRGTHAIKVVAPGRLAKIRVSLDKPSFPADGKAIALVHVQLEDANGVPVTERTALTLDAARGEWQKPDLDPRAPGLQLFVEGGSTDVPLRAPLEAGDAAIKVAAGTLVAETKADFVPDLRPLVAAGLFDGAISLKSISGNTAAPKRDFDGFEDQLRHFSGNASGGSIASELGARGAFFAKGKVADKTLLTMSYDSDKAVDTPLFRDLDPTAYYPTYGDSAQRGFDAQSTGRLYLRADREKSWLLYGDYTPPGVTPARNLGAYNRSLNGLRHHYEKDGLTIDSFASHDTTRQVVTEFAANGTSGPFLTGVGAMVTNSERIELITRDRNQPGILLARRAQTRWADYDIEPLTGRILFRAPVASLDADLNPVTIRISYEIDQGSSAFWVGGTAAQYKVTDAIEVGGSYVDDRNPAATTSLASVNATVKPDENTVVTVEAAQMDKMGALEKGRAARIDATRRDGKLESHVYAGRADINFDNPAASLPKGRAEAGVRATYHVDDHISFGGEVIHSADLTTGAARDGVQLTGGYAFGDGLRAEVGLRQSREVAPAASSASVAVGSTTVAQPDLTSVRAKVAAQVPGLPQAGVYVEGEQDVRDSGRRMVALGGDYRLAGGSRLYGRHELISSLGSNYALNDDQQRNATVFGVDSDYMKDGRVFSEYRARGTTLDGRQAEAALGLRNLWNVAEGVRVNTTFERVKVLSGSTNNEAVAVTGAIEFNRSNDFKANARLELRHAVDSDNLLNTLGMAYRLTDTWSLLGKNTLAVARSRSTDSIRLSELLQTGVAYRALATLGWNGLAKYEYKLESDDGIANTRRGVHSVAVSANYQPIRDTVFTARYAAKIVRDRSNGLDSRSLGQLVGGRVTHEISRDWDVGATAQVMVDGGTRSRQFGAGVEAGYQVRTNTWVSVGYNFLGFREPDMAGADATARGAYVRLRMKFDERTLASVLTAPVL